MRMTTEERDAKTEQSYADAQAGQKTFAEHHADAKAWHDEWLGGPETVQAVADFDRAEATQLTRERTIDLPPTVEQQRADAIRQYHIDDDAR